MLIEYFQKTGAGFVYLRLSWLENRNPRKTADICLILWLTYSPKTGILMWVDPPTRGRKGFDGDREAE